MRLELGGVDDDMLHSQSLPGVNRMDQTIGGLNDRGITEFHFRLVLELERRLRGRGQDSADIIARRTAAALSEMRHVNEFDYVIINNKLPEALEDLQTVVRSVRLHYASQRDRHRALFSLIEHNA